jgi:hypothetical protein
MFSYIFRLDGGVSEHIQRAGNIPSFPHKAKLTLALNAAEVHSAPLKPEILSGSVSDLLQAGSVWHCSVVKCLP